MLAPDLVNDIYDRINTNEDKRQRNIERLKIYYKYINNRITALEALEKRVKAIEKAFAGSKTVTVTVL